MNIARYEPLGAFPGDAWNVIVTRLGLPATGSIDRYHPASNSVGHFPNADGYYSWCRSPIARRYSHIAFLPGCRLLNTAWTKDWLALASVGLVANGQLILPYQEKEWMKGSNGLILNQLQELIGSPEIIEPEFAVFRPSGSNFAPRSILGFFMTSTLSWVGRLAEYRNAEKRSDLTSSAWINGSDSWSINQQDDLRHLTADFLSEAYADLARYLVFAVQGINSKTNSLLNIFRDLFGYHRTIRWADLGSGSGFLGIDIAITHPVHVFNIDKSLAQTRLGIDMLTEVESNGLKGTCHMITGRLETVELPDNLDAITMLTSLCYVPKEAQRSLLRRAWDALRPGGALLIYENIKSNSYSRDYDLMFDEPELNSLLDELGGNLTYRHALTGKPTLALLASGKTCYRTLVKP